MRHCKHGIRHYFPLVAKIGAAASALLWAPSSQAQGESPRPFLNLAANPVMYWHAGVTSVHIDARSSAPNDLQGPVVRYGDENTPGLSPQYASALAMLSNAMRTDHPDDAASQGLGLPKGVDVKVRGGSGLTLTVGRYLDDDQKWAAEAYVLGTPFSATVKGAGRIGGNGSDSVDLGDVITTKLLGPIAYGKYIFGNKEDRFRASVGVGGAYMVFFGAKVSDSLAAYSGGQSSVEIKNAFGPGIFLGADWQVTGVWKLKATLGALKLSTESTVTTRTDPNVIAYSPTLLQAARDVGSNTLNAMQIINGSKFNTENLVPGIGQELALARTGSRDDLGTYRRSINTDMTAWMLTISIGRDF